MRLKDEGMSTLSLFDITCPLFSPELTKLEEKNKCDLSLFGITAICVANFINGPHQFCNAILVIICCSFMHSNIKNKIKKTKNQKKIYNTRCSQHLDKWKRKM